jgi:hypothetical protein
MFIIVTYGNNKTKLPGDWSGQVWHVCGRFMYYLTKVLLSAEGIYCLTILVDNQLWTGEEATAAYFETEPPCRAILCFMQSFCILSKVRWAAGVGWTVARMGKQYIYEYTGFWISVLEVCMFKSF